LRLAWASKFRNDQDTDIGYTRLSTCSWTTVEGGCAKAFTEIATGPTNERPLLMMIYSPKIRGHVGVLLPLVDAGEQKILNVSGCMFRLDTQFDNHHKLRPGDSAGRLQDFLRRICERGECDLPAPSAMVNEVYSFESDFHDGFSLATWGETPLTPAEESPFENS
jgi:hypothetical protein